MTPEPPDDKIINLSEYRKRKAELREMVLARKIKEMYEEIEKKIAWHIERSE